MCDCGEIYFDVATMGGDEGDWLTDEEVSDLAEEQNQEE